MALLTIAPDVPRYREVVARVLWRSFFVCAVILSTGFSQLYAEDFANSSAEALVAGDQAERLTDTIEAYTRIQDAGGWPVLGEGPVLAAGMRHADVRAFRRRLRITGDFDADMGADPLMFDIRLVEALQRFQQRHGIQSSGVLGRLSRNALSFTVEQRIEQLVQARIAWTEFSAADTAPRLWVNIPEATVVAVVDNRIAMQMRAVVGHPSRQTPVLSSSIERVVINPTWTVPTSIALKDLIPRQIRNSSYFRSSHIRVYSGWDDDAVELDPKQIDWTKIGAHNFPYRLRQDAGSFNSLGRLKFIFPNEHDVYLHDTPTRALLGLSYRTISSGCIRVEEPEALANWMVAEKSRDRLNTLLESSDHTPRSVRVEGDVAIDLVYLTAWVSPEDGTVQFRRDIYGLSTAYGSVAAR